MKDKYSDLQKRIEEGKRLTKRFGRVVADEIRQAMNSDIDSIFIRPTSDSGLQITFTCGNNYGSSYSLNFEDLLKLSKLLKTEEIDFTSHAHGTYSDDDSIGPTTSVDFVCTNCGIVLGDYNRAYEE